MKAIIMAGGTGGHVFPGLAVAAELQTRGWQIEWLGTAKKMEAQLVPKYGYKINFIDIQGIRGNGLVRKLAAPFKVIKAVMQARKIFKASQPDLVIGMGGFASGPGALAARLMGVPVVLHEQNAIAGLTNRLVANFATVIFQAFAGALTKAQTVGNPVRAELLDVQLPQNLSNRELNILVVGGSLGAKVLNETVPHAVAQLADKPVKVWHQCGNGNANAVQERYSSLSIDPYKADDFIDDMQAAYSWADLVICRAGALTVSELMAVGRAAILVPLPYAVDDHQTANANVLVNANAGILLPQSQLKADLLAQQIKELTPEQILQMAQNAKQIAITNAATQVADTCDLLVSSTGAQL